MGDMSVVERALQDMRALIQLMQEEVNKFQETKKKQLEQEQECQRQVELQVQQEAQKAAAQLAIAKAQKKGGGIASVQNVIANCSNGGLSTEHLSKYMTCRDSEQR